MLSMILCCGRPTLSDDNPYKGPAILERGPVAESGFGIVRSVALAIATGVVSLVFVSPSIPFSDLVRGAVTIPTWIVGTGALLWILQTVAPQPSPFRWMTVLVLMGWTTACIAISTVVAFGYALALHANTDYKIPVEWIWCRAVLAGLVLALIPVTLVLASPRQDVRREF